MQSRMERKRGGFTLIELIAVVVIMGLIAVVTVTRLDFLVPKYRLRGAAREVGSLLGLGKAHAASNGKDVFFEVDLTRGAYWLLAPFPKAEPGDERGVIDVHSRPLEYQPIFEQTLPDSIQFTDVIVGDKDKSNNGRSRVRISALGSSGHVILNMKNDEGKEISVRMNGFTGMISYVDGRQEAEALIEDPGQ